MLDIYQRTKENQATVIEIKAMKKREFDAITNKVLIGTDLQKIVDEVNSCLARFLPDEYGPREFKYVVKRVE